MLFKTLKRLIAKQGLTDELKDKINTLYALGQLTEEQYHELMAE